MGENQKDNDLFYVCSLIEYLARKTKNTKSFIITRLGKEKIQKIYDLADVYHCEDIDKISDELIDEFKIEYGNYDVISKVKYDIPTYWEIGRVYQNLIIKLSNSQDEYIDKLIEVLNSWIIEKIDNYNSSMYYENPSYIFACYVEGKTL